MISLIPKGKTYKSGEMFPIISLPVNEEGESQTFNDFQWWAPTEKWNSWLKSSGRSWQAESEDFGSKEEFKKKIYESLVSSGRINSSVVNFDTFNSLFEDEEGSESASPATEEEKKAFIKFNFAYNELLKSGKLKSDLVTNDLQKGRSYAIVNSLPDDTGASVLETRNALKTTIVSELPTSFIVKMDESIPFGKIEDDSSGGNYFSKIAKGAASLAASGMVGTLVTGGSLFLGVGLGKRLLARKAIKGGESWISKTFGRGIPRIFGSSGGKVTLPSGSYIKNGIAYTKNGVSLAKNAGASRAVFSAAARQGLVSSATPSVVAAETATGLGTAATVGLIALGALAVWEVGQRIYNWTSDKQAPRLGEIEDLGWARDSFQPGAIPDGENITVCWTHSSGNNWFEDLLWNEDTRTTMDLIKLGNFNGRSVFLLGQINSKEFDAILKSKEVVLISFDEKAKFSRGYFNNDDLDFQMITVEKGGENLIANTVFQGYCDWDEMESAYKSASNEFFAVPENAPKEYDFHFKWGKSNRDINVKGTLIENLESAEKVVDTLGLNEIKESITSHNSLDWRQSRILESNEVLSFSDFTSNSEYVFEEEGESESVESPSPEEVNQNLLTGPEKIAAYEVSSIYYADESLSDQDLPDLRVFIVPNDYLSASDNEEIFVQPVQDVIVKYPRKGIITVESSTSPEPIPGATGEQSGGVPVKMTKGEVKNKFQDNPGIFNSLGIPDVTKIKDNEKDDEINFLDVISNEERKELGMEDWGIIQKVKIYKNGKTGDPYLIKFKSGDKKAKFGLKDPEFDTALKVAERIEAGFQPTEEEGEKKERKNKKEVKPL
jgi:hypothetical protein